MTTNNTEKNPEQKEKKNLRDWFTEGIILAFLSILGYCVPYVYVVSYASYYHIPSEYISNDLGTSISVWLGIGSWFLAFLLIFLFGLFLFSVIQWPLQYKKDYRSEQLEFEGANKIIILMMLAIVYFLVIFTFNIPITFIRKIFEFLPFGIPPNDGLLVFQYFLFVLMFIAMYYFYKWNKNNIAFQIIIKLIKHKIVIILLIAFFSIAFINRLGLYTAENQKSFYTYTIKDKPLQEMVVVFSSKDLMISSPLNRASKTIEPKLTMSKIDEIANNKIVLTYENDLGILKPINKN